MQDRPNTPELLTGISSLLHDQLLPLLTGPELEMTLGQPASLTLARDLALAADLLLVLEREHRLGAGHLLQERRALCRLLDLDPEDLLPGSLADQVADLNQQLVADIDDNQLSSSAQARVHQVVLAAVSNKLAVVHPDHLAWDSGVEIP